MRYFSSHVKKSHGRKMESIHPINLIQRFLPLCKAMWMIADLALDIRMTIKYREYASEYGAYHDWAVNHNDPLTNKTETVSDAYFYISFGIFFLPPLILSTFVFASFMGSQRENKDPKDFLIIRKIKLETEHGWFTELICFPIWIVIFFFCYIFACSMCYLFIPFVVLSIGLLRTCKKDLDGNDWISAENLPMWLIFENLGEALPQLCLSITFLVSNYPFIREFDTILGIQIPVSVISCVFSTVSLSTGIYTGIKIWCKENRGVKDGDQK